MNKKQKKILCLCVVLGGVLCLMVLFLLSGGIEKIRMLIKPPSSYTWDEYEAMSNEEKDELFDRFDSMEDFESWKESVQPKETEPDFHWDEPGKKPNDYTWEEYQSLTSDKKEAFYQWFGSQADFEAWLEHAKSTESEPSLPDWNKPGKQPDEYTWLEYQALSIEDRDAFFLWFASEDAFETWMNKAKPAESTQTDPVWKLPGKKPKEYTWAEYQALSPQDQDAFYHWFSSRKAFETWMNRVKPDENDSINAIWDKPGKKPDEYTWAEYQALSPEDQELFYQWFDSMDDFEAWMEKAEKE